MHQSTSSPCFSSWFYSLAISQVVTKQLILNKQHKLAMYFVNLISTISFNVTFLYPVLSLFERRSNWPYHLIILWRGTFKVILYDSEAILTSCFLLWKEYRVMTQKCMPSGKSNIYQRKWNNREQEKKNKYRKLCFVFAVSLSCKAF